MLNLISEFTKVLYFVILDVLVAHLDINMGWVPGLRLLI